MNERIPAEVFPPGEFVREEIEARGWTQDDLASILGCSRGSVNELVLGKKALTTEMAITLAEAFGTSPQFWVNLESAYRLATAKPADSRVSKRAMLYEYAPIREMIKRGWIESSDSLEVLAGNICHFFNVKRIEEIGEAHIAVRYAARKRDFEDLNTLQLAWLLRVRQLAKALKTPAYSKAKLEAALEQLKLLRHEPIETRHVPKILGEAGVRFVVVEALAQSGIDGVCSWLDSRSPVIGISLRFGRIDNFWFVLRHEIEHVLRGHGKGEDRLDMLFANNEGDLDGVEARDATANEPEEERVANEAATEFCVPSSKLEKFILRTQPLFSARAIARFANNIGVHPGLVVGQLQHKKMIPYRNLRTTLVDIRQYITSSALTDGWGHIPQVPY